MAKFELKLPKMGESVAEATLTSWLKEVGDTIEEDEAVLEIATDKVDSEVPSEVTGVLVEKLFEVDDVIQVGQTIAVIEIAGKEFVIGSSTAKTETVVAPAQEVIAAVEAPIVEVTSSVVQSSDTRFYSPLVKNIAAIRRNFSTRIRSYLWFRKRWKSNKKRYLTLCRKSQIHSP